MRTIMTQESEGFLMFYPDSPVYPRVIPRVTHLCTHLASTSRPNTAVHAGFRDRARPQLSTVPLRYLIVM